MNTAQLTNLTLYRLLVRNGASEADAEAAASVDTSVLATKADIAELKADLTWRYVVILGAQTALFSAIVAALKFVK
jgi:hypothetical protein